MIKFNQILKENKDLKFLLDKISTGDNFKDKHDERKVSKIGIFLKSIYKDKGSNKQIADIAYEMLNGNLPYELKDVKLSPIILKDLGERLLDTL